MLFLLTVFKMYARWNQDIKAILSVTNSRMSDWISSSFFGKGQKF